MASMLSNLNGVCGCGPIVNPFDESDGTEVKESKPIKAKPEGHVKLCW